ncbi:MAG TPA: endonuclease/exonuclease/phosphatase family protein [Pirellulales bacterium]|nr:endonuclease/exonuclease/phosphatase family protein [Pirellulales bacterium]
MQPRLKWKIRWWFAVILLMVLGPYFYSRALSPWRAVTVHVTKGLVAPQTSSPEKTIRIVTYNIAHGRGQTGGNWDGGDTATRQKRLQDIADLLAEENPDVVVLNECDFDSTWSHHVNQAEVIAAAMNMPYRVEQRNLDFRFVYGSWRFGNVVISRFPIRKAELLDLPGYSWWETLAVGKKRGVLCWIELPDSTLIRVVATHLSHRTEDARVQGARELKFHSGDSKLPLIVAGDLNSAPRGFSDFEKDRSGHNAVEVLLKDGWLSTIPQPPADARFLTFPSHQPDQVIDWIMVSEDLRFASYHVIQSNLSDHCPVVADVVFKK